jgi:hypothetical protein
MTGNGHETLIALKGMGRALMGAAPKNTAASARGLRPQRLANSPLNKTAS